MKKHNYSRQRDLILRIIRHTNIHPTASWIYEEARKIKPDISLGTVYRNLRLLRSEGKIQEFCMGNEVHCYDGDLREHSHIRCTECGRIVDIPFIT
jgi:Fur family ferric uptake transcriptional regulator/Fur family peroxide stress response transcriptional regulator